MKNIIIKYGIISGLISAGLMLLSNLVAKAIGPKLFFDYGMYIGYTSILIAMAVIFLANRHYRDNLNNGSLTFVQGLIVGMGVTVISCIFYSLMWLVVYYNLMPNFMEEYINYEVEKMTSAGASAESIAKMKSDMVVYQEMYSSPLKIFLITLLEPLPVGLLLTFIFALVQRKSSSLHEA
ncbi:MAG TPA: DUF4199 domain-containing protein [Saprospiraceae bacterium]|nr:DUF4199 domain-containing protein [Saprospiraceae bacterium]HPN70225.1 DUF4199 domain-containing protein [Saprospiraceae bacterium]